MEKLSKAPPLDEKVIGVDQLLLLDLGDGLQRRLVQIVRLDDAADVVDAESVERVVDALASVVVEVELVEDLGDLVGVELALLLALGKEVAELFALLQLLGGGQSGEDLFVQRRGLLFDDRVVDHALLHAGHGGKLIHDVEHDAFHDVAQAARAGLALDGPVGDGTQGVGGEAQGHVVELEQLLVLPGEGVLGLGQDTD